MLDLELNEAVGGLHRELQAFSGRAKLLAITPKPIVSLIVKKPYLGHEEISAIEDYAQSASVLLCGDEDPVFRSVSLSKLNYVLKAGCDVDPTDSAIFAGELEKALEYGFDDASLLRGEPTGRLTLTFSSSKLRRSFREVEAAIDESELKSLRRNYPTVKSRDEKTIWLSRFPADGPKMTIPYEREWGWYIPGDPFESLSGLIVTSTTDDLEIFLKKAMSQCPSPEWQ